MPYQHREPFTEDALLLIEVGESSLSYDRRTKLRLYAEAGVPEYWIVDAAAELIDIHRQPGGQGYRERRRVTGGDAVVGLEAFPDVTLTLAEIFA